MVMVLTSLRLLSSFLFLFLCHFILLLPTTSLAVGSYYLVVTTQFICFVGNHTVAAVKIDENFAKLKGSLQPVLDSIHEPKRAGTMRVGVADVKLTFYLGGDYKVYNQSKFNIMCYAYCIVLGHVNGFECC